MNPPLTLGPSDCLYCDECRMLLFSGLACGRGPHRDAAAVWGGHRGVCSLPVPNQRHRQVQQEAGDELHDAAAGPTLPSVAGEGERLAAPVLVVTVVWSIAVNPRRVERGVPTQ